jgi:Transport and Golgi organisation 2
VLVGAVRDEFMERPWDPPDAHWPGFPGMVGGLDRLAGGTWLAVDPQARTLAALLNGPVRLPPPADGVRPSRGGLVLDVLAGRPVPAPQRYDSFHLLRADLTRVEVWSWRGEALEHQVLPPGDHVIVNDGVDADRSPLVQFVRPALAAARTPDPRPGPSTADAWGDWVALMAGGNPVRVDPTDPRALIVRHEVGDRVYGSTSVTLVALGEQAVRYDFTANPGYDAVWSEVKLR